MHNGQIIQQLPAQFSQNIGGFNQIQPIAATITNATFQSPPQNNTQNDIVVSSTTSNPIQFSQQIISPVATPQPQIIQSTDPILSSPPSITFTNSQPNGTVILGGDNKQLHEISSPPPFSSMQGSSEMINLNINTHHQQQPIVTTKPARKPKKSKKKLAQEQQQQQQQLQQQHQPPAIAMISPTRNNHQASAGKIDLANVMKICGIMDDDFMDTDDQGMEQSFETEQTQTIHIPSNSNANPSNNESSEITITIPSIYNFSSINY